MISKYRFQNSDWEDFYPNACEPTPLGMPKLRGKYVSAHCSVDTNNAGDKTTRISMTGVLIFCNWSLIICQSKRQNSVEALMFGSEFTAMKNSVELNASLRYKLRIFGVPIDGSTENFCDN